SRPSAIIGPEEVTGYRSTSSSNRYRIGRTARPDGEMAPVNVIRPEPLAKTLCIAVLFESRDFTAASFPRSAGEWRDNGATRSLESASASSDRGSTASVGPGSTSAMYPRKLTITDVFSIWAALISTTCFDGWLGLR